MRQLKNYYSMLGVSNMASMEEIKAMYKKLVKAFHPDVNKEPYAEIRMREINEAYDILGDPEKKARYDIVLNHYINPPVVIRYYSTGTNFQQTIDGNGFTVSWTIYS